MELNVSASPKYGPLFKCKVHREFVRTFPCLVCGYVPCDDHHPLLTEERRRKGKSHDYKVVPLCREHHGELHDRNGNEQNFMDKYNLDFEKEWTRLCRLSPSKKVRALK